VIATRVIATQMIATQVIATLGRFHANQLRRLAPARRDPQHHPT